MPSWYFVKDDFIKTPSRLNGIDANTEARYRREGARFIMDLGNKLGLRFDAMATGMVYYHRFYMIQSFKSFPRWVTATACLFLAGKVEETPKKCRDMIKAARSILSDPYFSTFGEDPREEVMIYERILLQTIKFDLQVEHPYPHLLKIGKALKGDREKMNKLVQMAWTFINDSMTTTICLRYKPEIIALSLLMLAGKLSNYDMQSSSPSQSHKPWFSVFVKEVSGNLLEEICDEMLELYGGKKKEKERELHSDGSASNTSSPSVPSSPPVKKKKPAPPSESKLASTPAPPVTSSQPPPPPLPPQTQSLLVENISPAVTPAQTIPTTASQSSLSLDTRQSSSYTSSTIPTMISSQRTQLNLTPGKSDYGYATLNPTFLNTQSRGSSNNNDMSLSSATLATSASFLTSSTSNYSLPPPHLPLQGGYLPPGPVDYSRPPPPVIPSASGSGYSVPPSDSLYPIPLGNLAALKNQHAGMGLSNQNLTMPPLPPHQSMGLSASSRPLPPPPMPPIPNPVIPPPGHMGSSWPQRFAGPPPSHGGWMR